MSARIRSLLNGAGPINEASRDDLAVTDVVTVTALDGATTYAWSLAYVPEGSAAVFSGDVTAISPGNFTADLEGPYLVRLTVDETFLSESTQYVRIRCLTATGSLKLMAAGERYSGSYPIPVDATSVGWADEMNGNLLAILGLLDAIDLTAYLQKANNLSDLSDASAARGNLGLGTMAVEAASDYLTKADNLASVGDAATARGNLSAQEEDATLTAFAGLSYAAGTQVPAFTGADTLTLLTIGTGVGDLVQFDGSGKYPAADGSNITNIGESETVATRITKASHGFTSGVVLTRSGGEWVLAVASSAALAEVYGMVGTVVDGNTFDLVTSGRVTGLDVAQLVADTMMFLSDVTPGQMTDTAPSAIGSVRKPVFLTDSISSGWVTNMLGIVIVE